jgi:radical SAM superfamily enzyme YgiQ (UPF0313 family)
MKAIIVQPPFTQLNAPYPAAHYLESFLRGQGVVAAAFDHSIELYRRIFSRAGLCRLFSDARGALDRRPAGRGDAEQIERYLSYETFYVDWIEGIVDFLSGGDSSMAHRLAQAVELPRGMRASAFLDERDGRIDPEESPILATLILEDLGDFLSFALDPNFATVRYAERIASSRTDFSEICRSLESSYLMESFYRPYLREFWTRIEREEASPLLVLVSLPFPGSLLGGLACAREARRVLGDRARIVLGGGYVSTELRGLRDPGIFDFCDYLAFDAGYGALLSIISAERDGEDRGFYRIMRRAADGGILASGFPGDNSVVRFIDCPEEEAFRASEFAALSSTFPDYRSAEFGRYLRVVDSANPMHRLWSDSPWLKYHLAHGCYWRRCTFCDTELEYVADFVPSRIEPLMEAADAASCRSGIHGLHFVDEAMPMAALLAFSAANRARAASGRRPFHYWGNVRFDASWTEGRCALLAASGLVAVSGGIEIATERGLEMTGKGFDLEGLIAALVALKRSGILVHAYLIYGFPGQTESDVVDSAECCRQLFSAGLVDSAFSHRFVLTRHSRMYREWRDGARPSLRPKDRPWTFANNDLEFEGESDYDPFEAPLSAALAAWMSGRDLERPAAEWFGPARSPGAPARSAASIPPGFVEGLLSEATASAGRPRPVPSGARAHWIAGKAALRRKAGAGTAIRWAYRGGIEELILPAAEATLLLKVLDRLASLPEGLPYAEFAAESGLRAPDLGRLAVTGLAVV